MFHVYEVRWKITHLARRYYGLTHYYYVALYFSDIVTTFVAQLSCFSKSLIYNKCEMMKLLTFIDRQNNFVAIIKTVKGVAKKR